MHEGLAQRQPGTARSAHVVCVHGSRRREVLAPLIVEGYMSPFGHQLERVEEVGVRDDGLARTQRLPSLELHSDRAALLDEDFLDGGGSAHAAAGPLGDTPREGRRDLARAALGEVHDRAGPVEVLHHVGHHRGERAVRGQTLRWATAAEE